MATQSQGIQQLLAAEKKAAEIVAEARKSKQTFQQEQSWINMINLMLFSIKKNRKNQATQASKRRSCGRNWCVQKW